MTLAGVLRDYRDEFICDLASEYGIIEYTTVKPLRLLSFLYGLPDDSRTKRSMVHGRLPLQTEIIAGIYDLTHTLVWFQTKNGSKGKNRPKSLLKQLLEAPEQDNEVETFSSGEEFMKAREKLLKEH